MTRKEEKQFLRRTIRKLERELSPRYRHSSSQAICSHLIGMPEYQASDTVFCFVGTEREIDTRPILEDALQRGKTLCVPLCTAPGHFEARQITKISQLVPGMMNILEPTDDCPLVDTDNIDFAIIPCLTCNHSGQRLGKGGGYYDRFLSHYRGGTILLCQEKLIREEIPVEPHDYPIHWVLTETCLYEDGTPARLG